MTEVYQFRVEGVLSRQLIDTFSPVETVFEHSETVFTCTVTDRAQMFGLVARCEMLGLSLVGLTRIASDPRIPT